MSDVGPRPAKAMNACVAQTVRKTARLVTRRYEEHMRGANLTASQFTILHALSLAGQLHHSALCQLLGFEETTMTRLLATMKRRDLIHIAPDEKDRRIRNVSLSTEGQALHTKSQKAWRIAQDEHVARLSNSEWATFMRLMDKLNA
ncbi:MAG: MarR family winged helix-turn-helix transcriptional regulator [Pseudomonadota bacterium]